MARTSPSSVPTAVSGSGHMVDPNYRHEAVSGGYQVGAGDVPDRPGGPPILETPVSPDPSFGSTRVHTTHLLFLVVVVVVVVVGSGRDRESDILEPGEFTETNGTIFDFLNLRQLG